MTATHSTTRPAAAANSKRSSVKPDLAKGKSLKKPPAKALGKAAVSAKFPVKKTNQKPTKPAPKAKQAKPAPKPKPAKPAPKAKQAKAAPKPKPAKPAPKAKQAKTAPKPKPAKTSPKAKPAKPAPKAGKAVSKVEKAAAKKGQAVPRKSPPGDKAASQKTKAAPEVVTTAIKKHAVETKHEATPAKVNIISEAAEKPAPKGEKPELRKDRSHDDAVKKPVIKRSSLVDFPVPPPPVRPPFVPPKPAPVAVEGLAPAGVNASHSPVFIQKQRQRLLDLRDDLVDALSGMTRDTIRNAPEGSEASGSGMHQGDAGSDAYDRDFALSVLAKEQDALYEIDQALRRIQKGSYGVCEMSNRKILQARLEAIPFARLTVECQAQWEKEYGNRRFRPSNEVGFSGGNLIEEEDSEIVLLDDEED
jgi:RNA polymerase-binding transcription factor DksA